MTVFVLAAVVLGWALQMLLTYRQTTAFRRQTTELRRLGTITVGVGGRRYRGGRAYVALAVDETERVKGALVLRGWTTFSRGRALPGAVGHRARKLAGAAAVPGLDPLERSACRQAAQFLLDARRAPGSDAAPLQHTGDRAAGGA